ncbi:hypothetical protein JW921_11260, partial [Candidatus Fermentibacterales bacterium]|nr:hypothetical protein [Candidatus Fermentibacterales bacterium]
VAEITAMCNAPSQPSVMYSSTNGLGLFRSESDGADWDMMTMPLGCGVVCAMVADVSSPDLVLALEGTG